MAGYSGTPLPQKLGIKPGSRVLFVNAPDHARTLLDPLPGGVKCSSDMAGMFDVIWLFTRNLNALDEELKALLPHLEERGGLWVSWPKKASPLAVEGLSENPVRDVGLALGIVDNKVCAVDENWSALRFVRRLAK